MELASQECCLHRVLFTRRYVTFVLVIITFVFTLYSVVVLERNRTRTTILKSILEQLYLANIYRMCIIQTLYYTSDTHLCVCVR